MKKWLANLIFHKNLLRGWLRVFVFLHNFSYRMISNLAIRENNGIHPKHRIMNYHKFFIDNTNSDDSVLDVGCGNGAVAFDVAEKVKKVVGIDIERKNIESAQKNYKKENLKFIIGDATKYDFNDKFNVIILSNVLEHIENRVEFLQKLKNAAPRFLIRVPLIDRSWLPVYLKENGLEYRLDQTHFIEYTEEDFKKEMEAAGLAINNYYVKWGEIYAVCRLGN
jgi:2-polyprenyl-3-methyl-5-hydroxy-6-metoxy-1,4-benzoquinol methylase